MANQAASQAQKSAAQQPAGRGHRTLRDAMVDVAFSLWLIDRHRRPGHCPGGLLGSGYGYPATLSATSHDPGRYSTQR